MVDLESATPIVTPSAAVAAILGDPTASVRYRGLDRAWVDRAGSPLAEPVGGRRLLPVVDAEGTTVAAIEIDGSRTLPPLLIDLGVSAIALRAANERATALADARRREVALRSRELVGAADAGRSRLEHDLHDGAQQLLVGLALTVGLRARAAAPRDPPTLVDGIRRARQEVLTLVDSATPAALSLGLAGALRHSPRSTRSPSPCAPTATCQPTIRSRSTSIDDRGTRHQRGQTAGASGIDIALLVEEDGIALSVQDDGVGGLPAAPAAVLNRVRTFGGAVRSDSPAGVGTTSAFRSADASGAGCRHEPAPAGRSRPLGFRRVVRHRRVDDVVPHR